MGGEGSWSELLHFFFEIRVLGATRQIGPFVRIILEVVELFSIFAVAYIAPVAVNDRVFARLHVGEENITIGSGGRIVECFGDRGSFELLCRRW